MKIKDSDQIDDDMQRGYSYMMNNDPVSACIEWKKTWSAIVSAMKAGNYRTIKDFDEDFDGLQSVFNWASDYEMELENSVGVDISFARERISFCTEYLERADQHEHNSLNKKTAIANSYFYLGMKEDGEKVYKALTAEHPDWGWGWIKWSDEYSFYAENRDYDKAINILNEALKVDGIDETAEIKSRLLDIYEECDMHEEASSIVIDDWDYGIPLSE